MSKLLGVFAHPDEESYIAGGTIAKYVKNGWHADLVCATRGEQGVHAGYPDESMHGSDALRAKELSDAAAALGVSSITFLDYKDGRLNTLPSGEIEDKLMRVFTETQPDVVITFEPGGITNHPDAIRLTLAATFAFQKYASDRHDANPDDPNPPKLYYGCMPESIVAYFIRKKYIPAESFGRPWSGVEDKKVTTVINIQRSAAAKKAALKAYRTQSEEIDAYLAIPNNPFLKQEYFVLRYTGITEAFMGKNDRVSDRL